MINHEELVQGGKDLLEAKGDLGQSLFDAGMGGVRLLPVIEALDDEAGGLFKSRARSGPEILKSMTLFISHSWLITPGKPSKAALYLANEGRNTNANKP